MVIAPDLDFLKHVHNFYILVMTIYGKIKKITMLNYLILRLFFIHSFTVYIVGWRHAELFGKVSAKVRLRAITNHF